MADLLLRAGGARSLLPSVAVLAGVVVLAAGIHAAQDVAATVAFAALAAVICRELQLVLLRRGLGRGIALIVTVVVLVLVVASLAVALVASLLALRSEIAGNAPGVTTAAGDLAAGLAAATGLPADAVPRPDASTLLTAVGDLLAAVAPLLVDLAMAVLIVTYLLLDADRLRDRMLRATTPWVVGRYDALARELVVYIRVRAVLGGAAAIADTILLVVVGVPYAVLWGLVSFLFSFVPNIGFVIALIPPTLLAWLGGGIGPALVVAGGYVLINLAFDYVLQPRMLSASLDISPVVVIVCILVWTLVIGPAGALLAVPLTITMRTLLLPFPGARWFVALLGPVPGDAAMAAPDAADAVSAVAIAPAGAVPGADAPDRTIAG